MFAYTTVISKQCQIAIYLFVYMVGWAKIAVDIFTKTTEWDFTFLLSTRATEIRA